MTFRFRDIRQRPTTVYAALPTEELQRKSVWMRMVLSAAMRACYQPGNVPVTLVIEEGYVLGHHSEIESALSILRGFNCRMTIVFQSVSQIKQLYPHTWGLFGNGAVLSFRPGDVETAEWLSKRSSEVTRAVLSASDPSPNDYMARGNWQQQKRPRIPVGKLFFCPVKKRRAYRASGDILNCRLTGWPMPILITGDDRSTGGGTGLWACLREMALPQRRLAIVHCERR